MHHIIKTLVAYFENNAAERHKKKAVDTTMVLKHMECFEGRKESRAEINNNHNFVLLCMWLRSISCVSCF